LGKISGIEIKFIPQSIVELLFQKIGQDGTLLMPSFSWDFPKTKYCDLREMQSKMGVLTEYFRKNNGVVRSCHPMYAFCAKGNRDSYFVAPDSPEYHPFKRQSVMGKLYDDNAKILFIGTDIRYCTFVVYCEYHHGVEYRFDKPFFGKVISKSGKCYDGEFYHFCRPQSEDVIEDYLKVKNKLINDGVLKISSVGSGEICSIRTQDLFLKIGQYLREDPWVLLKNKPINLYEYRDGKEVVKRQLAT
jgi:aminoglycoside N3'-acetyltransferase